MNRLRILQDFWRWIVPPLCIYSPEIFEDKLGIGPNQPHPSKIVTYPISRYIPTTITTTENLREPIPITHMNWIYYLCKEQLQYKLHEQSVVIVQELPVIKLSYHRRQHSGLTSTILWPVISTSQPHRFTTEQPQRNNETTPEHWFRNNAKRTCRFNVTWTSTIISCSTSYTTPTRHHNSKPPIKNSEKPHHISTQLKNTRNWPII